MYDRSFYNENVRYLTHLGITNINDISSKRIAIVLSSNTRCLENEAETFILAANLLSRLVKNIDLYSVEQNPVVGVFTLKLCKDIFPQGNFRIIESMTDTDSYDWILVVGRPLRYSSKTTYVYSEGWTVYLNTDGEDTGKLNPLAACAAACFGAAEVFKHIISHESVRYIDNLQFSLLNYGVPTEGVNPDISTNIDIGNITLVGAGAIGSAFIYALSKLKALTGILNVVDQDRYTDTNLNRYITAYEHHIGSLKVDNVEELLSKHEGLKVTKHPVIYNKYIASRPLIDTLISAVDKRITRYNMQSDLPRLVLDASTTKSFIDINRVYFGSGRACLGCIYKLSEDESSRYLAIAEQLGLDIQRVKYLYDSSDGLSREDLNIVEKKLMKDLSKYQGGPVDSLYEHEYCGSGSIADNNQENTRIVAPISFISAFAGIFLASELIKDRCFLEYSINNHFHFNTFSKPNPKMHYPVYADPDCDYCSKDIYLEAFREKWQT